MRRRDMLIASGAALGLSPLLWHQTLAAAKPQRKVLFFTKSSGFEHSVVRRSGDELSHAEKVLTELGSQHNFLVTATKDGTVFDSDLSQYDAFFFYTTGDLTTPGNDKTPPMTPQGKQRLLDAVAAGKGFLGSHCASDTFHSSGPRFEEQTERDPYIAMLGGEFIKHGRQQSARQVISSADFPGIDKLKEDFEMNEEWYSLKNFADDIQVLLLQDTQGMDGSDYDRPPYPSTWARRHNKGRVFYTSMGHREDVWTSPIFQQVLLGGLAWAVGDVEFELKPNIKKVAPGAHVMPSLPLPKKPAPPKPKAKEPPAEAKTK